MELWKALNIESSNLSVEGPPGTGKSTEAWAWALWKAKKDNLVVTWFHVSKNKVLKALIDGRRNCITTGYNVKVEDIESSEGSILIVDGVTKVEGTIIRRACSAWCGEGGEENGERPRRYILVSSVSCCIALQENMEANIANFMVGSWTLQQYQVACSDSNFFAQVKAKLSCPGLEDCEDRNQLLLAKFFLLAAMFDFTYELFEEDFKAHLRKVSSYSLLYHDGSGDETMVAVSHLRGVSLIGDKTVLFHQPVRG